MGRDEIRVRVQREREDIKKLAEQIITLQKLNVLINEQVLFDAFAELFRLQYSDFEEQETKRYGAVRQGHTEEEKALKISNISLCALNHFRQNVASKFQIALMELMSESLGFADSIYLERCGAGEDVVNQARPTEADLQQNVLWWSIQRQRRLPTKRREDDSKWIETSAEHHPNTRAVYEVFNNLVLWAYDQVFLQDLLYQVIQPMVEKYDDPDIAAHNLSVEATELIWENIDGAAQMMVSTLVTFSQMLVFQSLAQQHNSKYPEESVQASPPISATQLKEIAAPFFDIWFEALSVKLNKRGRPSKNLPIEKVEEERQQFIQKIEAAIRELKNPDKGSIGLKLGYGKSRGDLQPSKEAAAKTLRDNAQRFDVDVSALIKKKKDRT